MEKTSTSDKFGVNPKKFRVNFVRLIKKSIEIIATCNKVAISSGKTPEDLEKVIKYGEYFDPDNIEIHIDSVSSFHSKNSIVLLGIYKNNKLDSKDLEKSFSSIRIEETGEDICIPVSSILSLAVELDGDYQKEFLLLLYRSVYFSHHGKNKRPLGLIIKKLETSLPGIIETTEIPEPDESEKFSGSIKNIINHLGIGNMLGNLPDDEMGEVLESAVSQVKGVLNDEDGINISDIVNGKEVDLSKILKKFQKFMPEGSSKEVENMIVDTISKSGTSMQGVKIKTSEEN